MISPKPRDIPDLADLSAGTPPSTDRHRAASATLSAADGESLHYRSWLATDAQPFAAVLFLHGIASHSAWFGQTAVHLAEGGVAVYAADRRGSGLSGGPRGHLMRHEIAQDDAGRFLDMLSERHPGLPIFLIGSSWSAKLAILAAARYEQRLAGLVLHGPGLFPRVDLGLKDKLTVLACHRLKPEYQVRIPLIPEQYTVSEIYRDYIRQDRLRLLTASSRFFWETRRLDKARDRTAAKLTLPMLLLIGEEDPMMDAPATCRWFHALKAPDRMMVVYKGGQHTLDFEPEQTLRSYRADFVGWLRRQAERTHPGGRP
jgi:alpha-beta hydrolase superfamily lysophospholipase